MPITPTIVDNYWKKKRTKKKSNSSLTSIFSHSFEFKFFGGGVLFLSFFLVRLARRRRRKKNSIKELFGVFPHCAISLLGSFQFIVYLFVCFLFKILLFTPPPSFIVFSPSFLCNTRLILFLSLLLYVSITMFSFFRRKVAG